MQHSESSKALKLLGLDGSGDKLHKTTSSTSLSISSRRLSITPETKPDLRSDGSAAASSLAFHSPVKRSELKPMIDELKLEIFFVDDRQGSIHSGTPIDLLRLFSVLICDPNLSNEGAPILVSLSDALRYETALRRALFRAPPFCFAISSNSL